MEDIIASKMAILLKEGSLKAVKAGHRFEDRVGYVELDKEDALEMLAFCGDNVLPTAFIEDDVLYV